LRQLTAHIPAIAETLGIRGVTQVGGRLDKDGTLHFFDINGLPGLCLEELVMGKQCFSCFAEYSYENPF